MALIVNTVIKRPGIFTVTPIGSIDTPWPSVFRRRRSIPFSARTPMWSYSTWSSRTTSTAWGSACWSRRRRPCKQRGGKIVFINLQPPIQQGVRHSERPALAPGVCQHRRNSTPTSTPCRKKPAERRPSPTKETPDETSPPPPDDPADGRLLSRPHRELPLGGGSRRRRPGGRRAQQQPFRMVVFGKGDLRRCGHRPPPGRGARRASRPRPDCTPSGSSDRGISVAVEAEPEVLFSDQHGRLAGRLRDRTAGSEAGQRNGSPKQSRSPEKLQRPPVAGRPLLFIEDTWRPCGAM